MDEEPKRRGRPPKQRPEVVAEAPVPGAKAEEVWIHPDSLWAVYGGQPPMFSHGSQDQAPAEAE